MPPTDDDDFTDARAALDLTPVPGLDDAMSPLEADLRVCRATCEQLQKANAAAQALIDEQTRTIEKLRADRRILAARVKSLEQKIVTFTGDAS